MNGKTYDYGQFSIQSAQIVALPQMINGVIGLVPAGGTPKDEPEAMVGGSAPMVKSSVVAARLREAKNVGKANQRFRVGKKTARKAGGKRIYKGAPLVRAVPPPLVPPPPPPPPLIAAIAVNDIGIGNCNMLIDTNGDPVAYYDCGYPLWFFVSSAPANIRVGLPGYLGPITQNAAHNLEVVLSHWDWDHYRYAALTPLFGLPIYAPDQPLGPAANNFANALPNLVRHNPLIPMVVGAGYNIHQCVPLPGMPAAALLNNSGLALRVPTLLPVADPIAHDVILTGDANYATLPPAIFNNVNGVLAVHHGSNAHGAGNPPPLAPTTPPGFNAYSYGITAALNRPYNFPVQLAVNTYGLGGWAQMAATPEAPIRGVPVAINRGNIRMGNQGALPVAYNYSAFAPFVRGLF